ncbi:MAG: cysteine desulfurase, partial [Christensenellaceae bacterium]|nr:cysteine desulfurase [Christensenellaceae bacterium]
SIMYANNEIGSIQDIKTLCKIAHKYGAYFHTDAVQAIGNIKVDVVDLDIDALSLSSHKFYGPKGVGALYVKKGISFEALIHGGSQEKSKRAGTENVAGIVGLGKAIEIADENCENNVKKYVGFREKIISEIVEKNSDIFINGDIDNRLANNLNLYIKNVNNSQLVTMLDMENIFVSGGSACHSGSSNPSHVIMALFNDEKIANSSIRITFGKYNTEKEIEVFIKKLQSIIIKLRK